MILILAAKSVMVAYASSSESPVVPRKPSDGVAVRRAPDEVARAGGDLQQEHPVGVRAPRPGLDLLDAPASQIRHIAVMWVPVGR